MRVFFEGRWVYNKLASLVICWYACLSVERSIATVGFHPPATSGSVVFISDDSLLYMTFRGLCGLVMIQLLDIGCWFPS